MVVNQVTLKDRFLNICKAAQRNFLGCRDKSLLSREVQALAYEVGMKGVKKACGSMR
jgi:hypothetical protein